MPDYYMNDLTGDVVESEDSPKPANEWIWLPQYQPMWIGPAKSPCGIWHSLDGYWRCHVGDTELGPFPSSETAYRALEAQ